MTDYISSADRWLGEKSQGGTEWKGICPYCQSHRLNLHVIGITYRPHTVYDFSDLPPEQQGYFKNLPNVVEAILLAIDDTKVQDRYGRKPQGSRIIVECLDCTTFMNGFINSKPEPTGMENIYVNKTKLSRYLSQLYGIDDMEEMKLRGERKNEKR